MTRTVFHFSLPLILLFTVALAVMRAQPYDDHELRELLLPVGCPAPCFMGIRPGVTRGDLAAPILRGHEWIMQVEVSEQAIVWMWNGNQPDFLYNTVSARAEHFGGVILISGGIVRSITLSSQLLLGDLYLTLGEPNRINSLSVSYGDYVRLTIPYNGKAFAADISVKCPVDGGNYWRGSGNVVWTVTRAESASSASTRLSELLSLFRRYDC